MIEIKNLTKEYGNHKAVNDISFTVKTGEILGFLGPNGAGKSTTMNILTGYLSATSGTVTIDGFDILDNPVKAKKKIGYLPELPPLYMDMTVREYLDFVYDLKKVTEDREEHLSKICDTVKITDVADRLIANLSKGYKQRVGIAQAMVGNPEVLILDEPTVGLDPKQIIEIRNVIRELGKNHTVILSSHILQEVNAICERVIIINKGRLMASDTPDNLAKSISNANKFQLRIAGEEQEISAVLSGISGVKYVEVLGVKEAGTFDYLVEAEPTTDIRATMFFALAEKKFPILSMQNTDITLEEIFLELTKTQGNRTISQIDERDIQFVNTKGENA